jgi:hypothetical protein
MIILFEVLLLVRATNVVDAKCIWLADPAITKTKVQIGSGLQRLDISL